MRTTIQALAAVLGGTQSLHTNAMDEALALPTEAAARLALRTQQVIAHESGVADTVDPLAGSYAVEHLTNEIERLAADYIEKIDAMGGMLRAIELGYVQREIQEAAYHYQRAVETERRHRRRRQPLPRRRETPVPTLRIDPAVERAQVERLRALRAAPRRRARRKSPSPSSKTPPAPTDNLLPHILACVEALATVGEISHRLRRVWGEYREAVTV